MWPRRVRVRDTSSLDRVITVGCAGRGAALPHGLLRHAYRSECAAGEPRERGAAQHPRGAEDPEGSDEHSGGVRDGDIVFGHDLPAHNDYHTLAYDLYAPGAQRWLAVYHTAGKTMRRRTSGRETWGWEQPRLRHRHLERVAGYGQRHRDDPVHGPGGSAHEDWVGRFDRDSIRRNGRAPGYLPQPGHRVCGVLRDREQQEREHVAGDMDYVTLKYDSAKPRRSDADLVHSYPTNPASPGGDDNSMALSMLRSSTPRGHVLLQGQRLHHRLFLPGSGNSVPDHRYEETAP